MSLEIEKEVNEELKNEAYAWQFLNDYLSRKLTSDVVRDLKVTGLFGVIDALLYLGLKPREIAKFYNFGHLRLRNLVNYLKMLFLSDKNNLVLIFSEFLNRMNLLNNSFYSEIDLNICFENSYCFGKDFLIYTFLI